MSLTDFAAVGRRIAEARGRAGLTQAALASRVPIDRSGLAKIEAGTRRVSALELARIADAVRERIEWFLEDAPAAIVASRQKPGTPSPTIDALAERIARNVEFIIAQGGQLRLESPAPLEWAQSVPGAERAAVRVRALLGLDGHAPFLNLAERAVAVGLLVFSIDLGEGADIADGASIQLDRGGVAVVNGHLKVGRRRLTAAHELGHHVFGDAYNIDWRIAAQDDPDHREALLDRFARAVLLPAEGLAHAWDAWRSAGDDLRTAAVRTASEFRVDMSTLAGRLLETSVVDGAEADQVRLVRTTKADILEFDLLVSDELAAPMLPRCYEASVLRLYRNETVSAARATDLLLDTWEDADLPELPALPEHAIWQFVS